jgi:hypothetical protein
MVNSFATETGDHVVLCEVEDAAKHSSRTVSWEVLDFQDVDDANAMLQAAISRFSHHGDRGTADKAHATDPQVLAMLAEDHNPRTQVSRTISWEVIDTPDAKSLLQAAISDLATQQGCTACPPKTIPAFSPMLAPSQDPEVPAIEPLSLLCEAHPGCRVRIDESRNTTFLIEPPCLQESAPPHTTAAPLEKASSAPEVEVIVAILATAAKQRTRSAKRYTPAEPTPIPSLLNVGGWTSFLPFPTSTY